MQLERRRRYKGLHREREEGPLFHPFFRIAFVQRRERMKTEQGQKKGAIFIFQGCSRGLGGGGCLWGGGGGGGFLERCISFFDNRGDQELQGGKETYPPNAF